MKSKTIQIYLLLILIFNGYFQSVSGQICSGERRLIRQTIRNNHQYNRLEFKEYRVSLNMRNFELPILKGNLKLVKDSAVQFSIVPAFGIEAGRIVVVRDSFYLINRLQRIYSCGNWKSIGISGVERVKLYEMQDLQLGNFPSRLRWIMRVEKDHSEENTDIVKYYLKIGKDTSEYPLVYLSREKRRIAAIEWKGQGKRVVINYRYKQGDQEEYPEFDCNYSDSSLKFTCSFIPGKGIEKKQVIINAGVGRNYRRLDVKNWINDLSNFK